MLDGLLAVLREREAFDTRITAWLETLTDYELMVVYRDADYLAYMQGNCHYGPLWDRIADLAWEATLAREGLNEA